MPKHTFMAWILPTLTAIALFFLVGNNEAAAAILADGTYEVEYTVKKPDNDSASIANDYFEKPARVEVRNGEAVVYFRTNHNKWITALKYPAGADAVELQAVEANEAEDTKVFRLPHTNVLVPAVLVVNVKIDELGYDQEYAIRLVFKTDQLPLVEESLPDAKPSGPAAEVGEANPGGATQGGTQDKPPDAGSGQQGSDQQQDQAESQDSPPVSTPELNQAEQLDHPVVSGSEQPGQQDQQVGTDAGASPEASADNAAPASSGNDAEVQEADSPEAEASGRGAWPAIMIALLAACALAAVGGMAYRRRRRKSKSQVHS